jgi:2-polyprenyl-3-methyl-5-hydroxy-6-metoxy-1,4-benzoquinol methylase
MTTKDFYVSYHDQITDKRFNSPYPLRKYVHRLNYEILVRHVMQWVPQNGRILDAGCGDGQLSRLMHEAVKEKGAEVIGADISVPNIQAARGMLRPDTTRLEYLVADAENLPYPDESFDVVVSSHVLEHLPDFARGVSELHRLTRHIAVVALPTPLNPSAAVLLGGGVYWLVRPRDLLAYWLGTARILINLGGKGIDEGYAGEDVPHLWRFPWIMRRQLRDGGFRILSFEGGSLAIPFIPSVLPGFIGVQKRIDALRGAPLFRNFGFGSIAVLEKI